MPTPKIITFPTPSLQQPSVPVADPVSPEIKQLVADLTDAMIESDGIGIAAPQVGKNIRLFLVQTKDGVMAFINPTIVKRSLKKEDDEEGCLSIPGVYGMVRRPKAIEVETTLLDGSVVHMKARGLFARVIQHEYDHIEGILFIDRTKKITRGQELLDAMKRRG